MIVSIVLLRWIRIQSFRNIAEIIILVRDAFRGDGDDAQSGLAALEGQSDRTADGLQERAVLRVRRGGVIVTGEYVLHTVFVQEVEVAFPDIARDVVVGF